MTRKLFLFTLMVLLALLLNASGATAQAPPAWELTGNTGTNPATNFLGTTDNQPLVIKTNGTEAMRITAPSPATGTGRVFIGSSSPNTGETSSRLAVDAGFGGIAIGNAGGVNAITVNNTNSAFQSGLILATLTGTGQFHLVQNGSTYTGVGGPNATMLRNLTTNGSIQFSTNSTERVRIDSSGNVGIGTTSPQSTLQVVGNYIQFPTISGEPPDADCDSEAEAGRVVVQTDDPKLWVCTGTTGWVDL